MWEAYTYWKDIQDIFNDNDQAAEQYTYKKIGFALLSSETAQWLITDIGPSLWVIGFWKESEGLPRQWYF